MDDVDQFLAASNQAIQSAQMIGNALDVPAARNFVEKMYKQQVKDNRENWQMQQAYNTPAMQMQRLKMAGLNPAMMMQGGADLGMAGSSIQAAGASSPSFAPMPDAPQYDLVSAAQADLMHAQADEIRSMLPGKLNQLSGEIEKSNKELLVMDQTIQTMEQDRFLAVLKNAREDQLANNDTQRTFDNTRVADATIDEIAHKIGLTDAQADQARAIAALTNRQLSELKKTFALRMKGLDLSNQKVLSEIGLNQSQVEYYNKIIEGLGYDNVTKSFRSELVKSLTNDDGSIPEGSKFAHRLGWLISELTQFLRIFGPAD